MLVMGGFRDDCLDEGTLVDIKSRKIVRKFETDPFCFECHINAPATDSDGNIFALVDCEDSITQVIKVDAKTMELTQVKSFGQSSS